jgi:hypothetical protein
MTTTKTKVIHLVTAATCYDAPCPHTLCGFIGSERRPWRAIDSPWTAIDSEVTCKRCIGKAGELAREYIAKTHPLTLHAVPRF